MEQNITPLVHLLSTADAETIAMNLDEIEYEYAYYLAIHQANEECLATDVHTAHNKIYWLRRLRNVFAQVAGIGFPTFGGFVSGCEALALSGRAACTKPMLAAVFLFDYQRVKK